MVLSPFFRIASTTWAYVRIGPDNRLSSSWLTERFMAIVPYAAIGSLVRISSGLSSHAMLRWQVKSTLTPITAGCEAP